MAEVLTADEGPEKTNSTNNGIDKSKDPSHTTSPYYLHPAENPDAVLVTPAMNCNNYENWSKKMKRALLMKNKVKFVNGKVTSPKEDDKLYEAWERCNGTVIAWIAGSLTPKIAQSVENVENAFDLWNELKNRFSKGDAFHMSNLMQEIHSIKQGERSISTYYTDPKVIWEDLEALRPINACACGVIDATIKRQREQEYAIWFLKGLNDQYSVVKTLIMMMEPLSDINKVFSLTLQEERQINENVLGETTKPALMASTTGNQTFQGRGGNNNSRGRGRGRFAGRGSNNNNSEKICSFCGKQGHTVETCYFKHGFPPGFKFRDKESIANNTSTERANSQDENATSQSCRTICEHHTRSLSETPGFD